MLNNFFRINLPYGLQRDFDGWLCFNREYKPLGFNARSINFNDIKFENKHSLYTPYKNLNEKLIESIAVEIKRNANDEIIMFFLYKDASNPFNFEGEKRQELWDLYCEKLQCLTELYVDANNPLHEVSYRD